MVFDPTNVPMFYMNMMIDLKRDWKQLHKEMYGDPKLLPCGKQEVIDSTFIVDDILFWANSVAMLLNLFSCACRVFNKYRYSFKLSKCNIL